MDKMQTFFIGGDIKNAQKFRHWEIKDIDNISTTFFPKMLKSREFS